MFNNETEKKKKLKGVNLVSTFFKNALRSNLDLTSLADTKAGILISINGFILTVSVTASSFTVHNQLMTYAFISIILTSLGSIIFAVMSVRPRTKNKLVKKEFLDGYSSLLYYQDMAEMNPEEYHKAMNTTLKSLKKSKKELISHLHILGSEIQKKYFWLKYAYTYFSLGLIISASLIVYALINATSSNTANEANTKLSVGKFYNIYEPSGATTIGENQVLIVEDESSNKPLKLITFDEQNNVVERGTLHIPKKMKKLFKKKIEDLEAITSDGNTIYAITSHSLSRTNKHKATREKLLMFHYENATVTDIKVYTHLKEHLIDFMPQLFGDKLLGYNDINIEGLSFDPQQHALLIGFRAPTKDGKAIIISIVNPKEIFADEKAKPNFQNPHYIDLDGLGIRGMQFDEKRNGFWILAGDKGKRVSKFQLYFLDKATNKVSLVNKDLNLGYSEGITIVQNNGERFLFCVEDNGEKPNKPANYLKIKTDAL